MKHWLVGAILLALLSGCARSPVPAPGRTPAPTAEPTPALAPAPVPTVPETAATPPPEPAPVAECFPEPRPGSDRIDMAVNGLTVGSLPAKDCRIRAVPGNSLTLRVPGESEARSPFEVTYGKETTLSLSLTGNGAFTYTFVPREPTTYALESAPGRGGPWSPVRAEFIPPQHRWLKIVYTAPLGQDQRPALSGATGPIEPPVEWESDRIAILALDDVAPVFSINAGRDRGGFPARGPWLTGTWFYRSDTPRLARVSADGQVTPIYSLKGLPQRHHLGAGTYYYQLAGGKGYTVDVASAVESDGPYIVGAHGFGETYVNSPAGGLLADLVLPGGPYTQADRVDPVDLLITDHAFREVARVTDFIRLHRTVPPCSWRRPALVWRPDGGAVAAISAAAPDQLQLVVYDLAAKERRVMAEKPGDPGGAYGGLTWAPGGRYLTFGEHLLDSQTGALITGGISADVRWNPTGTHLLEKGFSPFERWQRLALIEAATGKRIDLGYGDALGWLDSGEAVVVLWATARQVPGATKSCAP